MEEIVKLVVPDQDLTLIRRNAKLAAIGGTSNVRCPSEREQHLGVDQLVGQLCHYAVATYLTGSIDPYIEAREAANRNRFRGDGGRDVPGLPIDVKGSLMRGERAPADHRLLVRPGERRASWVYVLALVESLEPPVVNLMGWAKDSDLPNPEVDGRFRGTHALWADELRPISSLKRAVQATFEKRNQVSEKESEHVPTPLEWQEQHPARVEHD